MTPTDGVAHPGTGGAPPEPAVTDLSVRRAEPADAVAVADLYTRARVAAVPMMPPAVHTGEEDRAWFAGQLARPDLECWVAERSGELLGYALLTPVWLDHLFIRHDATGQGVGTVLLDLVKSLRPDGFSLWVFESNSGARRFYARHGLVELERTDGSGNEERAPDVRMAWPGTDPDGFFRLQLADVDDQLAALRDRREALLAAQRACSTLPGR
ncbi:GNAT family N-acetyltransferase [Nocardioides sp. MAHUQ-72]|uniref:GNAT family N-acetyltransferase n=1 Tax=unclassified Nocardioides TaxID=2615069 RepID=UPI0036245981